MSIVLERDVETLDMKKDLVYMFVGGGRLTVVTADGLLFLAPDSVALLASPLPR